MSTWHQYKACIKKIAVEKKRNYRTTLCEFLFHFVIMLVLVAAYSLSVVDHFNQKIYSDVSVVIPPFTDNNDALDAISGLLEGPVVVPNLDQYLYLSGLFSRMLGEDPGQITESSTGQVFTNLFYNGPLHFAPSSSEVTSLVNYMNLTYSLFRTKQIFIHESESDGIKYIMQHSETPVFGLIVLREITANKINYVIRQNYSTLPKTNTIISDSSVGLDKTYQRYLLSGFMTLQKAVDEWIFHYVPPTTPPVSPMCTAESAPQVVVTPYPTYAYDVNAFYQNIGFLLGLAMVMATMYPLSRLTKSVVEEKETMMCEIMKIMGLRDRPYMLSWFSAAFVLFFWIAVTCTLITTITFLIRSDSALIFAYFFLFCMAEINLAFLVSVFFSNSKLASIMAPVALFAGFVPKFIFTTTATNEAVTPKIATCLLAPSAFAFGADLIANYEYTGVGMQQTNMWTEEFNFGIVLLMLFADFVIYGVLALYLYYILPRDIGRTKHPLFCLYSRDCGMIDAESEQYAQYLRMTFQDMPEFYEQEAEERQETGFSGAGGDSARTIEAIAVEQREDAKVRIKALRKTYADGNPAVRDVSLSLLENQITYLLGHNGAGKSTVLSVLTGLMNASDGDALVYGKSLRYSMASIRKMIGFCPQQNVLLWSLTVQEHLEFFGAVKGIPHDPLLTTIETMLKDIGLLEKRHSTAASLSGGMKRKLSLAIALMGEPKFVLLDEPTNGMDPYSRQSVCDFLQRKKAGRVIVLTTHNMEEADKLADRIAIMSEGKIRCSGSPIYLKNRFGIGYVLTMSKLYGKGNIESAVERQIREIVPEAEMRSSVAGEMVFQLPLACVPSLPPLFTFLSDHSLDLGVGSYGISLTTLEQVFITIAMESRSMKASCKTYIQRKEAPLYRLLHDCVTACGTCFGANKRYEPMRPAGRTVQSAIENGSIMHLEAEQTKHTSAVQGTFALPTDGTLHAHSSHSHHHYPEKEPVSAGDIEMNLQSSTIDTEETDGFHSKIRGSLNVTRDSMDDAASAEEQKSELELRPSVTSARPAPSGEVIQLLTPSKHKVHSYHADEEEYQRDEHRYVPIPIHRRLDKLYSEYDAAKYIIMFYELLMKRYLIARRDLKGFFFLIIFPGIQIIIVLLILNFIIYPAGRTLIMDAELYPKETSITTNVPVANANNGLIAQSLSPNAMHLQYMDRSLNTSKALSHELLNHYKIHRYGAYVFNDTVVGNVTIDWLWVLENLGIILDFPTTRQQNNAIHQAYTITAGSSSSYSAASHFPASVHSLTSSHRHPKLSYTLGDLRSIFHTHPHALDFTLFASYTNADTVTIHHINDMKYSKNNKSIVFYNITTTIYNDTVFLPHATLPLEESAVLTSLATPMLSIFAVEYDILMHSPYTVMYNSSSWHSIAAFTGELTGTVFRTCFGTESTQYLTKNHPLPLTAGKTIEEQVLIATLLAVFILIPLGYIPASFVSFIVTERISKSLQQQVISGMSVYLYWITAYLWDQAMFLLLAAFIMITLYIFSTEVFISTTQAAGAVFLLLFLYGASAIPLSYMLSMLFDNSSTAQTTIMAIHFLTGFVAVLAYYLMNQIPGMVGIAGQLVNLFRFFPTYLIGEGLINVSTAYFEDRVYHIPADYFAWEVTGRDNTFMFVEAVGYFLIVILSEAPALRRMLDCMERENVTYLWPQNVTPRAPVDMDVRIENDTVHAILTHTNPHDIPLAEEYLLVINRLTKTFAPTVIGGLPKHAVRGVSLACPTGERFGLLGVNGAGKTTLLNILSGDLSATSGDVLIAGQPLSHDTMRIIGYCPQVDPLLDLLTGYETLWFYGRLRGIACDALANRVTQLIYQVGLQDCGHRPCGTYSGGSRRKLSLAIALIGDPKLLLLDEPSTGMDPEGRRQMWAAIEEVSKERTVVLVSHSMEEVEALCTRTGMLVEGRFQCIGTEQQLKGRFGSHYQIDVRCHLTTMDKCIQFVTDLIPGAILLEKHTGFFRFNVAKTIDLGYIFAIFEQNKVELQILDYSISQCTLEQIFIECAKSSMTARTEI